MRQALSQRKLTRKPLKQRWVWCLLQPDDAGRSDYHWWKLGWSASSSTQVGNPQLFVHYRVVVFLENRGSWWWSWQRMRSELLSQSSVPGLSTAGSLCKWMASWFFISAEVGMIQQHKWAWRSVPVVTPPLTSNCHLLGIPLPAKESSGACSACHWRSRWGYEASWCHLERGVWDHNKYS